MDRPGAQALRGGDFARRALRQQLAIGDVGQLVAPLRLVHVVRAHQHRNALRRQPMQFLPEIAPRGRVHARRRLVQQQQLRPAQHAGRQRQPLLPAAGKRARQLVRAVRQPQLRQSFLHDLAPRGHAVHPRDEVQVFPDRQVVPVRELLRHVAGLALDLRALAPDVEAQAGAGARVRREQAAHHPDGRGLAAAVGAEETEDFPAPDLQRDVPDDVLVAEMLVQVADVDDEFAVHGRLSATPPRGADPDAGSRRPAAGLRP